MVKHFLPNLKNQLTLLLVAGLFISSHFLQAQDEAADDGLSTEEAIVTAGEKLYKNNCTQCHAINEVVIGPALKNVHERRSVEWLIPWIRNSQKVIQSGDEYAVALYNEYQKNVMQSIMLG